jgi:hypothetical protein
MLQKTQRFFWVLFLLTLPVTSFPYFPAGLGGRTLVRPLALYPLLVLLVIAVLPRLWTRPAPRTLLPFLAFVAVAAASTALGLLRGVDPVLGVGVFDRSLRALITLLIGGAFYLTVSLLPQTRNDLRFTLRWLYIGFAIALLWGTFQAVYVIHFDERYFHLLRQAQRLISIRRLFPQRISGMTYEPNWFAEQIAFLLMPWLFAAVMSGYSVFRRRWRWLTVELALLIWASGVLLFTLSRTGVILLTVELLATFLFRPRRAGDTGGWLKTAGARLLQGGAALLILGVLVFAVGSQNKYFSRAWRYWTSEQRSGSYLQYIAFDQRITYWETAYRIYSDYPWLGVGLGNYTFYFADYLADRPLYRNPELLVPLTPDPANARSQLTSVKSVFARLLGETGLVGMATFSAFVLALLGCAMYLFLSPNPAFRYWGRAGLLGMLVFLLVSFSFDSFSLPNMWVVFGLITAAANVAGNFEKQTAI